MAGGNDLITVAAVAAGTTAVVASFVPTDFQLDRYFKHWLPGKHRWYRLKVIVLYLVVTTILAAGAASRVPATEASRQLRTVSPGPSPP